MFCPSHENADQVCIYVREVLETSEKHIFVYLSKSVWSYCPTCTIYSVVPIISPWTIFLITSAQSELRHFNLRVRTVMCNCRPCCFVVTSYGYSGVKTCQSFETADFYHEAQQNGYGRIDMSCCW